MESIFDGLFTYEDKEDFTNYIQSIEKAEAYKLLALAIECGVQRGMFNLDECFCLYKCLETLKDIKNEGELLDNNPA